MKIKRLIHQVACLVLAATAGTFSSCDNLYEDLPECRLEVRFKFDYNMLSTDAFHTQVDKVELYVFDKQGIFLFKLAEEGSSLKTGNYRMQVNLTPGQYRFMAWAGAKESYEITSLIPGTSTITDMKLKLKRTSSRVIDKEIEPLWYGEIAEVNFTGNTHQTTIVNLIKDTNKVRFIFQGYAAAGSDAWELNMDQYEYEIIEANGHLNYDNSLLQDDALSYRSYFKEQLSPSAAVVEMNTMRLMENRETRFIVTEKETGEQVFNINLIQYLAMTKMEGHKWGIQEYLDRQDEYKIVFFFAPGASWLALRIVINDWVCYSQVEEP